MISGKTIGLINEKAKESSGKMILIGAINSLFYADLESWMPLNSYYCYLIKHLR
jgi:hypothetical protein